MSDYWQLFLDDSAEVRAELRRWFRRFLSWLALTMVRTGIWLIEAGEAVLDHGR